jgi:pimeloyl-ACP methyl ester carboxylesterase
VRGSNSVQTAFFLLCIGARSAAQDATAPVPPGTMVNLGAHRLHVDCRGFGSPTVVIENGFDEFSVDWVLVQERIAKTTRICTYDRAGYAWSEPGPKPRTYSQINLELRSALKLAGERPPYVLVGHSFGGPVVRNFALEYRGDVRGLVLVEAVSENERIPIGKEAVFIADWAKGRSVPEPRRIAAPGDRPKNLAAPGAPVAVLAPYDRLPLACQRMHSWALAQTAREDAANSEREWSPEYMAKWRRDTPAGSLDGIPLIVLTRAEGGYGNDLNVPAEQLESERKQAQAGLARLSTRGKQVIVQSGHDMQVEAPDAVSVAIEEVVNAVRQERR